MNQGQSTNQSKHIGGVVDKGRGGGRKSDKIHVQCYNFQKYGHYENECPASKKNDQESDARLAKQDEKYVLLMVTTKEEEKHKDQWYLNSGCSSHMTRRKDWFANISSSLKNKVKFTNDNTLITEGISDVLIMRRDANN